MDTLAQKAIDFALEGNWEEAIKVNLEIIKDSPQDVDALNRLARCYSELGDVSKARKSAQKVLDVDPLNTIAQKCLEKWQTLKNGKRHSLTTTSPEAFLEESGKTRITPLMHLGDSSVLATVDSGDEVKFLPHSHRVSVVTMDDKFLGRLHDDLAARIRSLLKSGFKYQVLVKSIDAKQKEISVFIREIEKGDSDATSFPPEKIEYVSFTSPDLVHKDTPEIEPQEGGGEE